MTPWAPSVCGALTVTQLRVPDKANEITCFAGLLTPFGLTGMTVIADALHAQCGPRPLPRRGQKAHYALCVKKNQGGLYEWLHRLPWGKRPRNSTTAPRVHGRKETLVVQVLAVDELDFPQAARGVRHRACLKTGRRRRDMAYVITDLTGREASPQRLPQRLAKIIRSQWINENGLNFVLDTAFREDASKVRTEHVPETMATLYSFGIDCLPCRRPATRTIG
ncbi:ISAs1 family transposase [Streptomyces formicae]|uniref:ISAs1 family transposase n=1 Tax=Streptomyces formicae TaxID=1616117 RepID=A0ABY3WQP9_9ACTN|nr:ISAs1 family transposase [Streptomyces formicae]UNM14968.1 ISAs1 family transposase [Streptomyces formicae]